MSRDPDSWLAPDVSVMHADQRIETYPEGAPAIAVEVTSDSISAPKLNAKMRAHAAAGAREVWTVYPDAGYVWTYYPARSLAERGAQAIRSELISSAASDLRLDLILGTE